MRKLIIITVFALLSTGCNNFSYSGACYADGKPYDDKEYLHTECTKYCSLLVTGVCKESIDALKQAENEAKSEAAKRNQEEGKLEQENQRKQELIRAEKAKIYLENQHRQDKIRCSGFGFADKTEGMANCMMLEQAKRDSASEAAMRQAEDEERMQKVARDSEFAASVDAANQAEQRDRENKQRVIQRQIDRNNQFYRELRENNNKQLQQMQQRRNAPEPVKSTDFACMSNCQNAGYSFGLCQSKCSY